LEVFEELSDEQITAELTKLKGIGRWTADVYLLMCLRRSDAFPTGDLGLIVGVQTVKKLPERPTTFELEVIGEHWRPFRAVATRIIWHYYLKKIRPYNNY
jgi:DNA-3-methyladenine glycosylase II